MFKDLFVKGLRMQEFLTDPTGFINRFASSPGVSYGRLMSIGETAAYVNMLYEIDKSEQQGEKVIVGIPGYGSHRRYRVRREASYKNRANPDGLVLARVNPNDDLDDPMRFEIHRIPVAIEVKGGRVVGGAIINIGKVYRDDSLKEEGVFIDHGSKDLFWYKRWKSG